jgi:hypothetical protein
MKTVHELREILSKQLDALEAGRTTTQKAQTVANIVGKFLHSIRLQLEYARLRGNATPLSIPALDNNKEHMDESKT